jgi:hypothetical protein
MRGDISRRPFFCHIYKRMKITIKARYVLKLVLLGKRLYSKIMIIRGIFFIMIVLAELTVPGCVDNGEEVYVNPYYPYFNITNVNTDKPDIGHFKINVTVTNDALERTIKYTNGSIVNTGTTCTQTINISIYSWSHKDHAVLPYNYLKENVTLAYNETKTLTFDLGTLYPRNYTIIVSTPSMNTTYNASMWDYGI